MKPFPIHAPLLWFIRNYLPLKQKPIKISLKHHVGGKGDYIGLWKVIEIEHSGVFVPDSRVTLKSKQ